MDTRQLSEAQSVAEEAGGADSGCRAQAVVLIEMGSVSLETKGFFAGLEHGLTPKS